MSDGFTLNDDGTAEVDLGELSVHIKRPNIGQFRTLSEAMERADLAMRDLQAREWPDEIVEQANAAAIADLGVRAAKAKIAERAMPYGEMLYLNYLLGTGENPYPAVWAEVLALVAGWEGTADDLPAWMASPEGLGALRNHWVSVPLRHGPATMNNRANTADESTQSPAPTA